MKRILLMVLRNLWFVPYGWFKLCYTAVHVEKYTEEKRYQVLKMIDRRANIGGRITIDAYGVENIPKQDGFMFFPNHQGLYDVLAIIEVCPRPVLCGDEKRSSKCTVPKTGICLYESHPVRP